MISLLVCALMIGGCTPRHDSRADIARAAPTPTPLHHRQHGGQEDPISDTAKNIGDVISAPFRVIGGALRSLF